LKFDDILSMIKLYNSVLRLLIVTYLKCEGQKMITSCFRSEFGCIDLLCLVVPCEALRRRDCDSKWYLW